MEVNERFVVSDDYSLLPINVGVPSFATSDDCKQFMVMNTIVLLTTGKCLAEEGSGFVKRYMFLGKYTIYSSIKCITLSLEWFGKV